jgi:hypothetical protein
MLQVPGATKVTVEPETVQTEGVLELKVKARFELDDADSANGAVPINCVGNGANVMV